MNTKQSQQTNPELPISFQGKGNEETTFLGDPEDIVFLAFLESMTDEVVFFALKNLISVPEVAEFLLRLTENQRIYLAEALSEVKFEVAVDPQAAVDFQNFRRALRQVANTEDISLLF